MGSITKNLREKIYVYNFKGATYLNYHIFLNQ